MILKYSSILLNGLYLLTILLFVLDRFSPFEIKSQAVKSVVYWGLLILTPCLLLVNVIFIEYPLHKIMNSILPVLILIVVLIIGPRKIIAASAAWKTKTILYQHGHLSFKKVELQIQDIEASDNTSRTVEVFYLTTLFMITNPVDKDIDQKVEWVKVNIDK